MKKFFTNDMLADVGNALRALRLSQNLPQQAVADRSGVSLKAVKNLESGSGTTLRSFLAICRTLGKVDWVQTLAPPEGESPLEIWKRLNKPTRQRAGGARKGGHVV